jgi:hypothetical protein
MHRDEKGYSMHQELIPAVPSELQADPTSLREAMSRPDWPEWLGAMDEEYASHMKLGTWKLVELPIDRRGRAPIGNRWIYKTKRDARGFVVRRKARIVGFGYAQVFGLDYTDTSSPTLKKESLRLILVLVTVWNYHLKQMDVVTAYLHANMSEEVYMKQPEGYEQPAVPGKAPLVCLLVKALYGTKQAGMEWNREVNSFLLGSMNYSRCVSDPCVYHRVSRSGHVMLLGLFVDDIISAYHPKDELEWMELKSKFTSRYDTKDLGDATHLLGLRIQRDINRGIMHVDLEAHTESLLKQHGMQQCKSEPTPYQSGVKLEPLSAQSQYMSGDAQVGGEDAESRREWDRSVPLE